MIFALPPALQEALVSAVAHLTPRQLQAATTSLSTIYRETPTTAAPLITTAQQRAAYLAVRVPATYAAVCAVLAELSARRPDFVPLSLLDLGAGPGTVLWAASEFFPNLRQVTLLERDADFIKLGRELLKASDATGICATAQWQQTDLRHAPSFPAADLVTLSYALNELDEAQQRALVQRAWNAAQDVLVIVEPGTKAGYANILRARTALLAESAYLVAPCPHAFACPMIETNDWCHFAQRLPRTAQHRRAKSGALSYEDEKFSYLIAARQPSERVPARIVRHPFFGKGHVKLVLCTSAGTLATETVTARHSAYKEARKAAWGEMMSEK